MLRGWDDPKSPFENAPESPNGDLLSPSEAQQDNQSPEQQSGQDADILREWTAANEDEEEEKIEEEGEFDEIGIDPLTPTGDSSSVGTWSVAPGAVDRNSFNMPYDYEKETSSSFREHNTTSPRAGRSTKTSLNMSKDDIDQPASPGAETFDDIDLEALADTLPSPSGNRDNSRRYNGAWAKRFRYEMRTNPTFKFKLIIGASVLMVATCLVAIAVTLSSGDKTKSRQAGPVNSVGDPALLLETSTPTDFPTLLHTYSPSDSPSSKHPTGSPSYVPTFEPTLLPTSYAPTVNPTPALTTASPSPDPTTAIPTYEPSMNPVTYSPTMDCADSDGLWMTYNDKPRDCVWLDNDHNGAESTRKDMNCLDSELGEKCRYTCRLYNGCMNYLLSTISDLIDTDDISIGDSCADKEGMFLSQGGIPRNCTWMDEDPSTAPMKKNLNCGTPDNEITELGAMCPATCIGYNDCQMTESGEIVRVRTQPVKEELDGNGEDDDDDGGGVDNKDAHSDTDDQNPAVRMDSNGQDDCEDEDGDWENHEGKWRQCRWLDLDGEINAEAKKLLNCGKTEIGFKCRETCGCGEDAYLESEAACEDKKGLWKTHEGDVPRMCDWMDRKFAVERRELNCGKTEIGVMCQCKCSEPFQSESFTQPSSLEKEVQQSFAATQLNFVESLRESVRQQVRCEDEDGDWENHEGKWRQCRWLDLDGEINAEAKKLLNCGKTEIGFKCRETCGCESNAALQFTTSCEDKKGLWKTHEGDVPRMCDWMDRKFAVERRELNCGKTEIGVMCQCKCSEPFQSESFTQPSSLEKECEDEDGDWENHEGKWRQCRWLDLDGEINAEAKKLLNCGKTEIGFKCRETCGCGEDAYLESEAACEDKKGLWKTHEGDVPRMCDWMDRKFAVERRELNCGKTEIGVMCQCKCSEPIQVETSIATDLPDISGYDFEDLCVDEEGDWENHEGKWRQCRWLDLDGEINAEAKKLLNCGKTEIGLRCRETCGCGDATSLRTASCEDKKGEWETHEGDTRTCEWMDRKFPMERREQNCGITEIGVMCQCKCEEVIQDTLELTGFSDFIPSTGFIPLFDPPTPAPVYDDIRLRKHQGRLDESGKIMTIVAVEDATVSQRNEKMNYGDSIRLYVDSSQGAEMQALVVFDLSYVEQSISIIGKASLHIYARQGSPFGGVEFKKMFSTEFRQGAITWHKLFVDGIGDGASEPTIAFLDHVHDETWYEVDVTAAVRAAFLNGEERLGIRIVSSESDFTFASKDTDRFQPALVIDSRTKPPTSPPILRPTPYPTSSPVIALDCMDSKGFFVAHTGESQPCSWFEVGNGEQKKELNCKTNSEAATFCQSQCSAYNGCDSSTCDDKSGSYLSHTGFRERCAWLLTGAGTLKLEQNCGTNEYPPTELGRRCQATCANYNGCA